MHRLVSILGLMLALAHRSPAQSPAPTPVSVVSVKQLLSLSSDAAARHLPVKLVATVTVARAEMGHLFVMEDGYGAYVQFGKDIGLLPGDRVEVIGATEGSFRPIVAASQIRFLAHGKLPDAEPARFEDLIRAKYDCQFVTVTGHVIAAAPAEADNGTGFRIKMKVPQGTVNAIVFSRGNLTPENLVEADIRIRGVAGGEFDSKMQLIGIRINANSPNDVVVLRPPAFDPWSRPASPMSEAISSYRYSNESKRLQIAGTLTYFEPSAQAVLQDGANSILVKTESTLPLHAGTGVEASGFPMVADRTLMLEDAQLRPFETRASVVPQAISWDQASTGSYAYSLVAMEGEVVGMVHDARVDLLIVLSGGHLFSATLRHNSSDAGSAVYRTAPSIGSRVRTTGVCFMDGGNHWRDRLWFDLRMRSLDDVVVLQQPSWWTVKRLAGLVMAMSLAILIAVLWAWLLGRRLRKQREQDAIFDRKWAHQERQRSRILELISSPATLPEVLREIESMLSLRLDEATCRFELSDVPGWEAWTGPAAVSLELHSPDGASMGWLHLRRPPQTMTAEEVSAAMAAGARLAELAIDTRRLYSDLRHRSEYDLLTEIPNRFSMERRLDQLMLSTRGGDARFGLIYVDLDRFKQVNDVHGHRIGDLYLQQVARRMEQQLREGDLLARIGGDEFIALVPILHGRADAEEIAMRLERCFDEPFDLEGYRLFGAASIGLAVYPENGTSKEELQRWADSAMYVHKQEKRAPHSVASDHRSGGYVPSR